MVRVQWSPSLLLGLMWNNPWWTSLLNLLFVVKTYGKVSLWLWKSLKNSGNFFSYFVATLLMFKCAKWVLTDAAVHLLTIVRRRITSEYWVCWRLWNISCVAVRSKLVDVFKSCLNCLHCCHSYGVTTMFVFEETSNLCSYRVRGVDGSRAEYLHVTVESYMVVLCQQSYLLLILKTAVYP